MYAHVGREADALQQQLDTLIATHPVAMWRRDLDDLEGALEDFNKRKFESLNRGG
jgi:hypothetical protein